MLYITVDMSEWFDALDVMSGPGAETVEQLSASLEAGFTETQALVHVQTGSLKASGKAQAELSDDEWAGEISYGGSSPGSVYDPVTYATEEFSRGGSHDALRNIHLMYDDMTEAMFATVRARLGE